MLRPRIIPCLLVHDGGLVKTTQFSNPKYVGDPINAVKIFNEKEADELIVLDIDAAISGAEPNFKLISQFAAECRMPLCYGGGIKTVAHAKKIISLGVEKVALSSAAIENPDIVTAIATEIGSQSVVVVLDVRQIGGKTGYEMSIRNGKKRVDQCPISFAQRVEKLGAGEIVVNSIDRDGMMKGYDLELAARVRNAVNVPVTMLGGAGSLADIEKLIVRCGVVGAAAGSFFVFKGPYRAVLISYPGLAPKEDLIRKALGNGHA